MRMHPSIRCVAPAPTAVVTTDRHEDLGQREPRSRGASTRVASPKRPRFPRLDGDHGGGQYMRAGERQASAAPLRSWIGRARRRGRPEHTSRGLRPLVNGMEDRSWQPACARTRFRQTAASASDVPPDESDLPRPRCGGRSNECSSTSTSSNCSNSAVAQLDRDDIPPEDEVAGSNPAGRVGLPYARAVTEKGAKQPRTKVGRLARTRLQRRRDDRPPRRRRRAHRLLAEQLRPVAEPVHRRPLRVRPGPRKVLEHGRPRRRDGRADRGRHRRDGGDRRPGGRDDVDVQPRRSGSTSSSAASSSGSAHCVRRAARPTRKGA